MTDAPAEKMRAADVLRALMPRYEPPWACWPELRVGTHRSADVGQRMDLWAIATWPAAHFERVAIEIKVSRGDYRSEVARPQKRAAAMLLSNRFYFAVPHGLVRVEEVPVDCGLIEVWPSGRTEATLEAPWRDVPPPTTRFLAALAKRAVEPQTLRLAGMRQQVRDAEARLRVIERETERARAERDRLRAEVTVLRTQGAAP